MQAWFFVDRRDAHQALDRQIKRAAVGNEGIRIIRQNAGFLVFFAGVDLKEQIGAMADLLRQPGDGAGQFGAVDRMDRLKQIKGLTRLVGLERADKMQVDPVKTFAEAGPFAGRLLHAILAKAPLALRQGTSQSRAVKRLAPLAQLG
jgi:hypothetical protein